MTKTVRCGNCGEPGHNKLTCPNTKTRTDGARVRRLKPGMSGKDLEPPANRAAGKRKAQQAAARRPWSGPQRPVASPSPEGVEQHQVALTVKLRIEVEVVHVGIGT